MTSHKTSVRARREGSIFPYKNGRYAGYVWITTLSGERRRKYVYIATRAEVHAPLDRPAPRRRPASAGDPLTPPGRLPGPAGCAR